MLNFFAGQNFGIRYPACLADGLEALMDETELGWDIMDLVVEIQKNNSRDCFIRPVDALSCVK